MSQPLIIGIMCRIIVGPGLVPPAGFEPTTVRLEGGCSIQLSYGGT